MTSQTFTFTLTESMKRRPTMNYIEVVKVFYRMKHLEMFWAPVMTNIFSWLILKTRPPKQSGTWVFLMKVFENLINKHNKKTYNYYNSLLMTFPCTKVNRKSPMHHRVEKAGQKRHCNTKINIGYLKIQRSITSPYLLFRLPKI